MVSQSDISYLRAVRKAKVFQQLTDSTAPDYADDVVVDLLQKESVDVDPILDKAKEIIKDIDNIMLFELEDDELSTPPTHVPSDHSTELYITAAALKFWIIILLVFFLLISTGIFHFFCLGKKNVTRRSSLDKSSGATETTTMEIISEEIEMEEGEITSTVPVLQDF